MAYTLACKDAGVACPFVARGKTEEEVLKEGVKHVKEVHGYTDEQVKDPKFLEESKKLIKKAQLSRFVNKNVNADYRIFRSAGNICANSQLRLNVRKFNGIILHINLMVS